MNSSIDEIQANTSLLAVPWWQSRAMLGSVATIIASLAGLFGMIIDVGALTEVLLSLATVISGALALYGTWKRTTAIDQTRLLPGSKK